MIKKGFTLIELLVVVIIMGILLAVVLPYYNKVVERSRMSDIEQLMGRVVNDQQMIKLRSGNSYTENWNALSSTPTGTVKGKVFCSGITGIDFQSACPEGHSGFRVELFGLTAPDPEGGVVATREGNTSFGGYKIYRFYEGPDKVYCWADTEGGKEMCIFFLDTDSYQEPDRLPPGMAEDKVLESTVACNSWKPISQCYVEHYSDGSSIKKDQNEVTTSWTETAYDKDGNKTSDAKVSADGTVSTLNTYDPETGEVTGQFTFHANGMVKEAITKDPITGQRAEHIRYDENGNPTHVTHYDPQTGTRTDMEVYDPATGGNKHFVYGPDGNSVVSETDGAGGSGKDHGKTYCEMVPGTCKAK